MNTATAFQTMPTAEVVEQPKETALAVIPEAKALEVFLEGKWIDELLAACEEQAKREQEEREARIAQEAAEKATREAEEKAAREKAEAEARELRAKLAQEQAEKEAAQAKADAEAKAQSAVEAERRRIAEEKAKAEAEEAARQADGAHKFRIHGNILEDFQNAGADMNTAMRILDAIRDGEVRNLKIIY